MFSYYFNLISGLTIDLHYMLYYYNIILYLARNKDCKIYINKYN